MQAHCISHHNCRKREKSVATVRRNQEQWQVISSNSQDSLITVRLPLLSLTAWNPSCQQPAAQQQILLTKKPITIVFSAGELRCKLLQWSNCKFGVTSIDEHENNHKIIINKKASQQALNPLQT